MFYFYFRVWKAKKSKKLGMFSNKILISSSWTRRLKLLSIYKASPAYISTSVMKLQVIKVELNSELEEKLAANKLKVKYLK